MIAPSTLQYQVPPKKEQPVFGSAAERVADGERQQGNEAYKRGDLKAAEAAYTRSAITEKRISSSVFLESYGCSPL